MEFIKLNYEEMQQEILERVNYTYNVKEALSEDIGNMEACGIVVKELTFDNVKVEITINEPIEVEEDKWERSYNLLFL